MHVIQRGVMLRLSVMAGLSGQPHGWPPQRAVFPPLSIPSPNNGGGLLSQDRTHRMTANAIEWQSDFEVVANQDWSLKNINKGDIVHFKRGTEPKEGDIVAVGSQHEAPNKCQIHVYHFLLKDVLGVCVAVTRTVKPNDRTRRRFGVAEIQTAVQNLWEAGADNLDKEALEWFSGFSDTAQVKCDDLSNTLMNIGCTIMNDDKSGSFQDECDVADLLFLVRDQINAISAMLEISGNAAHRLKHSELYKGGVA